MARLRGLLLDAVSDNDLKAIVATMVDRAKAGDVDAAREVLTRLIGRPGDAPDPDRLARPGRAMIPTASNVLYRTR